MNILSIGKAVFKEWKEDRVTRLAAALSFYTMISLAPLLVLAIWVGSQFFGRSTVENQIVGQLQSYVGPQAAGALASIITSANQPDANGTLATIVSLGVLLFGASNVFAQLQLSLNTIWDVEQKPNQGIGSLVKHRLVAFLTILGIGVLMLLSVVLTLVLSAAGDFVENILPGSPIIWQAINLVISLGILTLLFAMIFKLLPDVKIQWRDVWVGAAVTAVLFMIGQFLLSLYLANSTVGSSYGAAGSVIVILIWVYYSTIIVFSGAEFTQVYARQKGKAIRPKENAQYMTEGQRSRQGAPAGKEGMNRPAILDEPNPGYASPLAYPASELGRMGRQVDPIPVTGPQPPAALKVVPVLVLGAVAAGFGMVEATRAAVGRVRRR